MNSLYPIGSIYLGIQNKCPLSDLIPGSHWELVSQDRVLQVQVQHIRLELLLNPGCQILLEKQIKHSEFMEKPQHREPKEPFLLKR